MTRLPPTLSIWMRVTNPAGASGAGKFSLDPAALGPALYESQLLADVTRMLKDGQDHGRIDQTADVAVVARALSDVSQGAVFRWVREPDTLLHERIDSVIALVTPRSNDDGLRGHRSCDVMFYGNSGRSASPTLVTSPGMWPWVGKLMMTPSMPTSSTLRLISSATCAGEPVMARPP